MQNLNQICLNSDNAKTKYRNHFVDDANFLAYNLRSLDHRTDPDSEITFKDLRLRDDGPHIESTLWNVTSLLPVEPRLPKQRGGGAPQGGHDRLTTAKPQQRYVQCQPGSQEFIGRQDEHTGNSLWPSV